MAQKTAGTKRKKPKNRAALSKPKGLSLTQKGYLAFLLSVLTALGLSLLGSILRYLTYQPWEIKGDSQISSNLISNPRSVHEHLVLAKQFLDFNNPQRALEELKIIHELGMFPSGYAEVYQSAQTQAQIKKQLANDRDYWRKITQTRPYYRDGWYQLGVLSWLLEDRIEGKKTLTQALELDPNFEPAKSLLEKIKEEEVKK